MIKRQPQVRPLSSTDCFILAMMSRGAVETARDLQTFGGLSTGSSVPVLDRLLRKKLIRRAQPRENYRKRYVVTELGEQALGTDWEKNSMQFSATLEATLRGAWTAILLDKVAEARNYLLAAAGTRERAASRETLDVYELRGLLGNPARNAGTKFKEILGFVEAKRAASEATLLNQLAELLPMKAPK